MNNYKITIQYDGTRYKGWQGQNSTGLTIQGKIEAVLGQMAGHAFYGGKDPVLSESLSAG